MLQKYIQVIENANLVSNKDTSGLKITSIFMLEPKYLEFQNMYNDFEKAYSSKTFNKHYYYDQDRVKAFESLK